MYTCVHSCIHTRTYMHADLHTFLHNSHMRTYIHANIHTYIQCLHFICRPIFYNCFFPSLLYQKMIKFMNGNSILLRSEDVKWTYWAQFRVCVWVSIHDGDKPSFPAGTEQLLRDETVITGLAKQSVVQSIVCTVALFICSSVCLFDMVRFPDFFPAVRKRQACLCSLTGVITPKSSQTWESECKQTSLSIHLRNLCYRTQR
jgi:hypothetical protein